MGRFFALVFLYSLALSIGSGAAAHAISTVACSDVLTETASIAEDDVNQSNEGSSEERSHCVSSHPHETLTAPRGLMSNSEVATSILMPVEDFSGLPRGRVDPGLRPPIA